MTDQDILDFSTRRKRIEVERAQEAARARSAGCAAEDIVDTRRARFSSSATKS